MATKPTHEELKQRIKRLEKETLECERAQRQINEQTEFMNLVLESLPHPFYVIDASDYTIRAANPAAQTSRLSKGATCYAFIHKKDEPCGSAEHPCPFDEIKKMKKPVKLERIHYDKVGNPRNVEVHAYPILDTEGNVSQIMKSFVDITELKRTEGALRESEAQQRLLIETMNDGLVMRDENGLLSYVNRRFLEMIGYSKNEVMGHPVEDFLDAINQKILQEQIVKRRKRGRKPYELVWTGKDGRKIPSIVSPEPIFDEHGSFKGSFAVVTEITELKRTEQELRDREKELEVKTAHLEDANAALKVLLKRRDEDKTELEDKVLFNMKELVEPYLEKLKRSGLGERQKDYANILESNLKGIVASFSRTLSSKYSSLTPAEIQIANLVKHGKSTKEIADLFNLSARTIEFHRDHIREKLGIKNKKANLRTRLLSIR